MLLSLQRAVVLACVGVAVEVAYTALTEPQGGARRIGYSYLWMFPVYALIEPALSALRPLVGAWAWPARAALYAAAIMVVELIVGLALQKSLGEAPWEPNYRKSRWHVLGVVRLDYFPAWAGAAMLFERAWLLLAR